MKHRTLALLGTALLALTSGSAIARNTKLMLPIQDVINGPEAHKFAGVKFAFGGQSIGVAEKSLGEFSTTKKASGFDRTDEEACRWAMASALIQFRNRAQKEGGDAVVNIRSVYKKLITSNDTEYECHAGATGASVSFSGEVVKLK